MVAVNQIHIRRDLDFGFDIPTLTIASEREGVRHYYGLADLGEHLPGTMLPPNALIQIREKEALQTLMDELYDLGVRPSAAQEPKHIQQHLSDMRKIASKFLEIQL